MSFHAGRRDSIVTSAKWSQTASASALTFVRQRAVDSASASAACGAVTETARQRPRFWLARRGSRDMAAPPLGVEGRAQRGRGGQGPFPQPDLAALRQPDGPDATAGLATKGAKPSLYRSGCRQPLGLQQGRDTISHIALCDAVAASAPFRALSRPHRHRHERGSNRSGQAWL